MATFPLRMNVQLLVRRPWRYRMSLGLESDEWRVKERVGSISGRDQWVRGGVVQKWSERMGK
jgi:hypothetical protein